MLPEIPELTDAQWTELVERLTLHAESKMRKLYWRGLASGKGGKPPGAVGPDDMAAESITDFLEGRRVWNKSAEPELLRFLMDVIDSKVNHLAEKLENRVTRESESGTAEPPAARLVRHSPAPDVLLMESEALGRLRTAMIDGIGKDEIAGKVFDCLDADITKPSEMAEVLGIPIADVNNAQKRLRRIADRACAKLGVPKT